MPGLKYFFNELKARNVRKTMAIYVSSALTGIAVIKLFLDAYALPAVIFPIVVTIFSCGFVSAFVFAWYHGNEGTQKFLKREIAIHTIMLIAAIAISFRVGSGTKPAMLSPSAKSIAVLPFKNMSENKEDEYFSDGITEDILTQLCKIGDLRVVSRTSIVQYKNTQKPLRDIAEELGVGTILEGSVRRYGTRMRITGQLIDARTDEHLWAETYDREMRDVFSIQMDVAREIAGSLKATLSPDELRRINNTATENLDAYSYYLRGRELYNQYTQEANERAIELFRNAIALDSTYALAYAGLGDAYAQRVVRHSMPRESADSAIAVSTKAITLDRDLAEGYKALGLAAEAKGHSREALDYYYKAVKLNPNYAPVIANIGWVQNALGNYAEALLWMKKSVTLNPGAAQRYVYVAEMYNGLGDDSSAIEWYDKALTLQPDLVSAHFGLPYIYLVQGNVKKAEEHAERSIALDPENVRALEAAGIVQLFRQDYQRARTYFDKSVALSSLEEGSGVQLAFTLLKLQKYKEARVILDSTYALYVSAFERAEEMVSVPMYAAYICSVRNDTATSLQWIRRAIDMGFRDYRWAAIEPLLENVRRTREFTQLMSEIRLKVEEMRARAKVLEARQESM